MKKGILAFLIILLLATFAYAGNEIGKVETSGLMFKDSLTIIAIDDPDIKGVTCYATLQNNALSFSDSSNTSLSCRKVGKITGALDNNLNIFQKSKNLFFKEMLVSRFYDKNRGVLTYLSYTKKLTGKNASHSLSVVVVD